jgi:hypothetical protein
VAVATALTALGVLARQRGVYRGATSLFEQAVALARTADDQQGLAEVLSEWAAVDGLAGDFPGCVASATCGAWGASSPAWAR